MQYYDPSMSMCMPLPMADMPMKMLMLQGNGFGTYTSEEGPRGRDAVSSPNMFMADIGTSVGDTQYFNLEYMGTLEKWTFPQAGYPELLQIGEVNQNGQPFIDAQHPHSTPVMGLTLSDTIAFGSGKNNLKFFFAPRGEATEGPIPFMHRITGMINPDVPLGHHVGQDVAHISSTVMGGALQLGKTRFELSTFNGVEPEPDAINLPIEAPNSIAARVTEEFSPELMAMASASHINPTENRLSASFYLTKKLSSSWNFYNTLIYGRAENFDSATLNSFTEEFLFQKDRPHLWGRLEVVQRTPAELEITVPGDPNQGQWVGAVTVGYTHTLLYFAANTMELGLGASVTKDLLPEAYIGPYGGNPWTGKGFLELRGMNMFDL
jgi:hypothetical protein